MSGLQGTDSGYSSLGDYHLDLSLNGTVGSELEFYSGYKGAPPLTWAEYMQWILFNKQTDTFEKSTNILDEAINRQDSVSNKTFSNLVNNKGKSIYNVISDNCMFSRFKSLIDFSGYSKIVDSNISVFVPINDNFDSTLDYLLNLTDINRIPENQNLSWSGSDRPGYVMALQTLRYHILPYIIKPWQLEDRKLKLLTDLNKQFIESDFTMGRKMLVNPISPYFGDSIPSTGDSWFPRFNWEVNIVGSIECNNGMIYIIDRPLVFPLTV